MRACHLIFATVLLLSPSTAATAQTAAGDRVAGRVVNALDEHPLARATVTLVSIRSRLPALTTSTDDEGQFTFNAVPPGKYRMTGSAAGYVSAAYMAHEQFGTAIVTGAGLATDSLTLRLTPTCTISGRILDEAGEPVQNASIVLYRENPTAPTERIAPTRGANTGQDGRYEFNRLPPGKYFISAMGRPWYAVYPREDARDANVPYRQAIDPALDVAYPLIFYPHALDSDSASPIILHGGEQIAADMQFQPEHAVTLSVRSSLGGNANQRPAQLLQTLFGIDQPVQIQMSEYNNGVQSFPGLAPGQYKVREQTAGSRFPGAARSVDLTASSVALDDSAPVNLATVSVTVHAVNGETLPDHLQLNLRGSADGRVVSGSPVNDKAITDIANVPPGDYRFALNSNGHVWNVVSFARSGTPVSEKRLHVTGSENVAVDLTVSSTVVNVDGIARRDGKPVPGCLIILVPAGSDTSDALFRRDQSDLDGSFTFMNVVPGNYIVIAVEDGWTFHWTDTTALTPYLLHGLPVTVTANGSAPFRIAEPVNTQPR